MKFIIGSFAVASLVMGMELPTKEGVKSVDLTVEDLKSRVKF